MKRLFASITLAVALTVSGCATFKDLVAAQSFLTTAIANPIGLDQQYEIEAAVTVARRTAVEYFRLPQCRRTQASTLAPPCARRSVKVAIQRADQKLNIVLVRLRNYVAQNDQLNAGSALREAWGLIQELRGNLPGAVQ